MTKHWFATAARLGFGAALLLLLGARASSAAITLGPPIEVPRWVAGTYDAGSLAVLEDGSFAIGRRTGERRFEVVFYTPNGVPHGEPVTIYASNSGDSVWGGVGPFGDRYFVTWQVYGSGKGHATFFSSAGQALGRPFAWPYSDVIRQVRSFHYARGSRGRILPVFWFQEALDRFGYPSYASWSRVFGPEARFLGKRMVLMTDRHFLHPEAAALNEQGSFVVAFLRCPRNPLSTQPCTRGLQAFDGAWRPRSPVRSEGLPPVSKSLGPGLLSLALARTGDHLVTWVERFGPFPEHEDRVLARIFRRDGSPAGRVLRLNGPGAYASGLPSVSATHARTFVLAWGDSPEGFGFDMFIREIDGRTGKLGERILIASEPPSPYVSSVYAFDLQLNSSGRGVVWYGDYLRLVTVEPQADEAGAANANVLEEDSHD